MIILASASPRRKEICDKLGLSYTVMPAQSEIAVDEALSPEQNACVIAEGKAGEIFAAHPGDIVIGADTSVWLDGRVLGKPANGQEAFFMLKSLAGKTHRVLTGVAVLAPKGKKVFCSASNVTFAPLTDEEIRAYIQTGEPMDKAGAYGIQGRGACFVSHIDGDFYSVMGLPCSALYGALKEFL